MKYLHYKTENFLADKKFKEWVLSPNQDSDQFWKSFLNQYPNKKNDVLLARQIIASLKFEDPKHVIHFSDEELEYLIQDVFKLSENFQYW